MFESVGRPKHGEHYLSHAQGLSQTKAVEDHKSHSAGIKEMNSQQAIKHFILATVSSFNLETLQS